MEIRRTDYGDPFVVTTAGAGVNFDHRCSHGSPSLSLHLISEQDGTTRDLGVILPSCAAPALFGAAIAYLQVLGGGQTGDDFLAKMLRARDQALEMLEQRRAEIRAQAEACCEAGYRTQGREHTCRDTNS